MQDFIDAFLVTFLITFLLGSIPFGLIISRVFYKTDIRSHGSGNIGTTNAIRAMGKVGGYSVFVLDFGKGILSGFIGVWVGQFFLNLRGEEAVAQELFSILEPLRITSFGNPALFNIQFLEILLALSLCGCILGHIFSPWLRFKGGKGIAVAIGCVFVVFGIPAACLELAIFIVLVVATRYVSVGSIFAAIACPLISVYLYAGNAIAIFLCFVVGITIVWAHRENIKRLFAGTENRIGSKKKASPQK